ncbi:MAG TPA: dihydrofolate reductase family protein [Spirochaetota bacterium]|nr:dihydrofolate reductase family protein [Spirochaetota bacterium]HOR45684.1 dihydrofolate reductase family protein [Spirochaetota bacterium]HPK57471.1 dihydrofolate reductase family protein [Spirochaetota bacterium]
MANLVYIATSIDGYIATKDNGLDWLNNIPVIEDNDYGFADFLNRIDCILMGTNTFEKVLSFSKWPYFKKVFVMSNSLKEIPENISDKAEIVSGNINEIIHNLKRLGYQNLYVDGGKVIQSFLQLNLIDELIITRVPILLGDGIPLFGHISEPIIFSKVKTEIYSNGLVTNHYIK